MYRKLSSISLMLAVFMMPAFASAHVIVTPAQAGIGQELTFNISSPNEQQTALNSVKLDIPKGVDEIIPTAEAGWTITVAKDGSGDDAPVNPITWSGAAILPGQRQDFSFSAQVPATATELDWKAYQTYADGTVVHWDQKPNGDDDATGDAGPFSVTKVVNDLTNKPATVAKTNTGLPIALSIAALALAAANFVVRKKN